MSLEERLEKAEKLVAEVKAELAAMRATKRNWPERIEAGMVFALFDQLFMPFSHANDGVCRWKICLNDGMISELGSIGSSSTAFSYKGRGADGLRWSDPTEACINATDAHEPTGAELVGKVCEASDDGICWFGPWTLESYWEGKGWSWGSHDTWYQFARLA